MHVARIAHGVEEVGDLGRDARLGRDQGGAGAPRIDQLRRRAARRAVGLLHQFEEHRLADRAEHLARGDPCGQAVDERDIDGLGPDAPDDVPRNEPELGVEIDPGRRQGLGQFDLAGLGMGLDRDLGMGQMMREGVQAGCRRSVVARRPFRFDEEGEEGALILQAQRVADGDRCLLYTSPSPRDS